MADNLRAAISLNCDILLAKPFRHSSIANNRPSTKETGLHNHKLS